MKSDAISFCRPAYCSFTATTIPLCATARCTCAKEADAMGSVSIDRKAVSSVSGAVGQSPKFMQALSTSAISIICLCGAWSVNTESASMYCLGMPRSPVPPLRDATNWAALTYSPRCIVTSFTASCAPCTWHASKPCWYSSESGCKLFSTCSYFSFIALNCIMVTILRDIPSIISGMASGPATGAAMAPSNWLNDALSGMRW
mmetsp:Transcript_89661/g.158646  ORF Transcript_89661/g.158646 Transcript_89661/m.158646 type:complete len:202 (+) Transcript_89661:1093-1698(+)